MYSIQLGPSVEPRPLERSKDFIRWWIFCINEKVARIGSKSFGDDRWPDRKAQEELEKAFKGQLVAMVIEPSYDHGGYFDPGAGFIWEEDYAEWQRMLMGKIGQQPPPPTVFIKCPRCGTEHTAPTRMCRTCDYKPGSDGQ